MSTLTVNRDNTEEDETEYLTRFPAMKAQLEKAAEQEGNGEGVKISLDDIWK